MAAKVNDMRFVPEQYLLQITYANGEVVNQFKLISGRSHLEAVEDLPCFLVQAQPACIGRISCQEQYFYFAHVSLLDINMSESRETLHLRRFTYFDTFARRATLHRRRVVQRALECLHQ